MTSVYFIGGACDECSSLSSASCGIATGGESRELWERTLTGSDATAREDALFIIRWKPISPNCRWLIEEGSFGSRICEFISFTTSFCVSNSYTYKTLDYDVLKYCRPSRTTRDCKGTARIGQPQTMYE
ncbi:hypothetical protein EVAR_26841_1 [Eumeta japonica]|uniref:Uncharacterized protein n=1 Tax=Eumeta variegata TaxID=151549 RepID=A0A4C1VVB1_EUMVA|nr:hypothetical protein EVAR_26841_1 [Eumeta japonica]